MAGQSSQPALVDLPRTQKLGNISVFGRTLIDDADAAAGRTTLGLANHDSIVIDTDGQAINLEQPCFLVHPTSNQNNIAIDSDVTVVWGTEIVDQGANFATNTFTAPVAGNYQLQVSMEMFTLDTAATNYQLRIVTSNRTYQLTVAPGTLAADGGYQVMISCVADMDAADTAICVFRQDGGTQQTDMSTRSRFSGCLLT